MYLMENVMRTNNNNNNKGEFVPYNYKTLGILITTLFVKNVLLHKYSYTLTMSAKVVFNYDNFNFGDFF